MKYLILLVLVFTCNPHPVFPNQTDDTKYESIFNSAENTVLISRNGMHSVLNFIENSNSVDLTNKTKKSELPAESKRIWLKSAWTSFLDYFFTLESLEYELKSIKTYSRYSESRIFHIRRAIFLTKYRFALEFITEMEKDTAFHTILNDKIPEEGFPSGLYSKLKFNYLNVMTATEFAAYNSLSMNYEVPKNKLLVSVMNEDSKYLWNAGKGKGEILTAKNSLSVIKEGFKRAVFPVQKNISETAGDIKILRHNKNLISKKQIEHIKSILLPGDILLERREWYLTNAGIPGFWTHAAIYIGTSEQRKKYFNDSINDFLKNENYSDIEFLLKDKYPSAYSIYLQPDESGYERSVVEAISEGVLFTSIEHSADCDSIAVLRPRLSKNEIAKAIIKAYHYSGRPYDFDFNFLTDSALVCTELVYKSYETANNGSGIPFIMETVAGRKMLTANGIARTFESQDSSKKIFDFVLFYDGIESKKLSILQTEKEFVKSIKRGKWHIFMQ
ncbi:MAG: hypothetical protein KBH06_02015 [Spirochaetes bacterium]|nr:hypothetical protein [Spirochaetota bacterium]